MSEPRTQDQLPALQQLVVEIVRLRERVEDLEDARELDEAIRRNGGQPLIPWDQAKKSFTNTSDGLSPEPDSVIFDNPQLPGRQLPLERDGGTP
jgi:hypothetical protein